jgi:hypothetical protein
MLSPWIIRTLTLPPLLASCSDPTSDGQVSVYLCYPWISMLAHTVHQCIYQSAITCISNEKLIYTLRISAETGKRVWSPINAIGKLSVDRNPIISLTRRIIPAT